MVEIRNVEASDALLLVSAKAGQGTPAFEIREFEGTTWGTVVGAPADGDISIDGQAFRREEPPVWDLLPMRSANETDPHVVRVQLLRRIEERAQGGLSIYFVDRHAKALKDAQEFVGRKHDRIFDFIGDEGDRPVVLIDDAVDREVHVHVPEPTEAVVVGREEFERDRWVRVLCDHSADGLWHKDGSAAELDALPVSPELRDRLRAWQDVFEKTARDDGSVAEPLFGRMGLLIAQDVKAELPDWTVVYFDADKYHEVRDMPDKERSYFEYEIELPDPAPSKGM